MSETRDRDAWRKVPQPRPEPGDVTGEVCCTCGLRGRQCVYVATCHHYHRITKKGLVYG